MEDEKIRQVGQQIIEKHIGALREIAEHDQYRKEKEALINDDLDDYREEDRFRKFLQSKLQREADVIMAELQAAMEVNPELRNLKVSSELEVKVYAAVEEVERKRSK